jgi:hypothetical protein
LTAPPSIASKLAQGIRRGAMAKQYAVSIANWPHETEYHDAKLSGSFYYLPEQRGVPGLGFVF